MDLFLITRSKKLIYIEFFDQIRSLLIFFISLSINFELFDIIRIQFNQIRRDDTDSDDEFRSKKSIKRRLEYDFSKILGRVDSIA